MRFGALIVVLVIVLGGGAFGLLVLNGTIKLHADKPLVKREVPAGATLVPFSFKELPANTFMTRELLTDPRTGQIVMQPVYLDSLKGAGVLVSPIDIVGRVLRHDKAPGYVFTEREFYPIGTRAGLTAAIPPGKRSMTLEAAKLTGARFLKAGDRVDLLAAQEYDPARVSRPAAGKTAAPADPPVKKAAVRVIAQDAVVVTPITVEMVAAAPGSKAKAKPLEEMEIAVDPEEVPALVEAIAAGADISCVVHSGQPEKPGASNRQIVVPPPPAPPPEPPPPAPPPTPRTVEAIIGRKHTKLVLPPTSAPSSDAPSGSEQAMDGARAAARQGGQP